MLRFESHGATHPARQRRKPCSAGLEKEENAPPAPGSAAQALDGVGLDGGTSHTLCEAGRVASHARAGSDPDMLVSHFPESVRHLACACGVWYGVRSTLMPLVVATRAKCGLISGR
jgi:hypothetical protein